MEKSPPFCTGGFVEYLAEHVNGLNWRGISTHCALSQTDLILFLCILCMVLVVLCVFLLSDLSTWRHLSRHRRFSLSRPSSDRFTSTKRSFHERMILMSDIVQPIHRPCVIHVQAYMSSKKLGITASTKVSIKTKSVEPLRLPTDGKDGTSGSSISLHSHRKSMEIQLLFIILMIAVILALVVGTVYTCSLARRIEMTIESLTGHIEEVAISSKQLANTFISEAYAIMNRVIEEDVAQNNPKSYLRPFVEEMKLIWGDQAMRLYAMAQKLSPSKAWLRQQTRTSLLHFNTFLRRLSSLFAVAPLLSESSIKSTNDLFLSYSYELARLTPHPLLKPVSWRDISILNFTATELCKHSTTHFSTCADVESHFAMIISKLEAWPRYKKSRDFTKVTGYSLLPRLLNAEAQVEKWLPLAQDPTGNIPFLFDEFLVWEIEKERIKLNESIDALPRQWEKSSIRRYLNVVAVLPFILAGALTLLVAISIVASLFNITLYCGVLQHGRAGKDVRMEKFAPCHLLLIAIFSTVLSVTGVGFGIVGSIGQSQLCDVLLARSQYADVWLNHLLTSIAPRVPDLRDVLKIENIHFRVPKRVFSTLDTNYTPSSPPFLQSVNMSRPVNLSALLHSNWLNKTLYALWYDEVWHKMEQANLSYQIPRVQLSTTFNKFRKAVNLDQTFDDLYVGDVTEYLPEPCNDYYTQIGLALSAVAKRGSKKLDQLANYFTTIGDFITLYKLKFDRISQALSVIKENKKVLEQLSPLIEVGDKIIGYLVNKTNEELISQFTNNTAEIFINSRRPIDQYVLPLLHQILDRLFPYPNLRQTYRKALSPICPTGTTHSPLFPTLKNFGFTLSLSAFSLFIVSVVWNRMQF
ncbi:unnamed protein product [Hydatigera taeniaeformis]|uniref:Guanylate cyclase domain-containing protein n=1 Tax=Hydatigena taeniaeformis TaxID=6205 RepID=A0A0R3X1S4_HYDTA|nr:unnamed protein product [Hydatigera taeniaeformis]